jgi:hypothetical protein
MRPLDHILNRFWIYRQLRYYWNVYVSRLPENIYFNLPMGLKIRTEWPTLIVYALPGPDGIRRGVTSSDPNEIWRGWLEENVGRQGIFWQWRIAYDAVDIIEIKILKRKEAVMFQLMN